MPNSLLIVVGWWRRCCSSHLTRGQRGTQSLILEHFLTLNWTEGRSLKWLVQGRPSQPVYSTDLRALQSYGEHYLDIVWQKHTHTGGRIKETEVLCSACTLFTLALIESFSPSYPRLGGECVYAWVRKRDRNRERETDREKNSAPHLFFVFLTLPLVPSVHLTGLLRGQGFQINHPKVFTNAKSQTQTGWHMATLFKCFSMCLWCQHLFHTYLHLKGEKRCFCDL